MTNKKKKSTPKGAQLEELVGAYFRKAGYFAVRGVPFDYKGYSITDIDLWLYLRSSSVAREITIVDIKNRKTPQAIERIFWTKGLQATISADRAIVATTDSRKEVKSFGSKLDITVLDGKFLNKLKKSESVHHNRLSEEEFSKLLDSQTLGKMDGDWRGRLISSKKQLAEGLNFDSINFWLEQGHFFAEQIITRAQLREIGLRAMFRIVSYIAIGVDYVLKDLSFGENEEKEITLRAGFTYGQQGRSGIDARIEQSLNLLKQFGGVKGEQTGNIRSRVHQELDSLPTNIIAQYFSSSNTARDLINVAKELDELSMSKLGPGKIDCSTASRGLIGSLLDFWGIDRVEFQLNKLHNKANQADR